MKVFCASMNGGPSYPAVSNITMLYLGTSEHEAVKAAEEVGLLERFSESFPNPQEQYSAIPATLDREIIKWYFVDGRWASVVMFDLY